MTDEEIIADFKDAFSDPKCKYLLITSRRQDIGIMKCERGVAMGLLRFQEVQVGSQETHWRYYPTDKAKELWGLNDK